MKNLLIVFPLLLFAGFSFTGGVKTIRTDKSKSVITYHMHHPVHSWDGVNKSIDGVVQYADSIKQILKVAIIAKVADFDSENSNRDSHMMEVTEALKYPAVNFVSTSVTYADKILVKGNLTFHGVTKAVQFYITDQVSGNTHKVEGNFQCKLTDFNIDPPSLMFVKTDDELKLSFSISFSI